MNPYIQTNDNPDITKERKNASFDVEKFSEFYVGGKRVLAVRREVEKYVEDRKELRDPIPSAFMSREELIDNSMRKMVEMVSHEDMFDITNIEKLSYYASLVHVREVHALSLHYLMFVPVIQSQGTSEQIEKWMTLGLARAISGTYAQTELGHGTNLSKLETTATYDSKTQEFILNTPKISAAKWWPGSLGKFSNHAVVVAILYTNGECKGPHPFVVQIRDTETHKVLPNIKLGDIGPKMGINASDNGYMIFNNLRIPRENMLMKHSKVLPDGKYIKPPHSKLAYGGMVFVRSMMVRDIANHLAIAATIATRYSSVRRQGEITPGKPEVQILDYQTQQLRIFPSIARAIAFRFAGQELRNIFKKVSKQLTQGNAELLPEIHALSSGLKAVVTFEVQQGIEQCRLSCGGHGYSMASAFPELLGFSCASCTYEGDNIVLLLQVAKFLIKSVEKIRSGQGSDLAEICEYLNRKEARNSTLNDFKTYTNYDIVSDIEFVARRQVFRAFNKFEEAKKTMSKEHAWNSSAIEFCKASRWHVKLYIVRNFFKKVDQDAPQEIRPVLKNLARLYAFDLIASAAGNFMENGYMHFEQIQQIKNGFYECLSILRPDAVSVVDGFAINEIELRSVLGRRDGNVYPALLEWAQNSSLNKKEVLAPFEKHIGPMMKKARSML
ncbi:unnamed protein product [Caenorhabditis angaria]|uniref:Acyl-coenzyme A oxidase n=1 Tax=Caenorhabditis angaria TaxID=860376 RepID=A0A9P1IW86_9PELO|nr:unnamed protein product [Caenorhabditis angaria]